MCSGDPLKNGSNIKDLKEYVLEMIDKHLEKMEHHNISEVYIGEFSHGLKSGLGKLWMTNNCWYNGQFSQNQYHGLGALYDEQVSTTVKKTTFVNGVPKKSYITPYDIDDYCLHID